MTFWAEIGLGLWFKTYYLQLKKKCGQPTNPVHHEKITHKDLTPFFVRWRQSEKRSENKTPLVRQSVNWCGEHTVNLLSLFLTHSKASSSIPRKNVSRYYQNKIQIPFFINSINFHILKSKVRSLEYIFSCGLYIFWKF